MSDEPLKVALDEDDILRIENLMLKEENAKMKFTFAQQEINDSRSELLTNLAAKRSIDIAKHKVTVNLPEKTLQFSPR